MAANELCTFRWKRFSLTAVQFYFNSKARSLVRVIGRIVESLSMPRNRLKRSESSKIGRTGSFPNVLNNTRCVHWKPRTKLVKYVKVFFFLLLFRTFSFLKLLHFNNSEHIDSSAKHYNNGRTKNDFRHYTMCMRSY